MQQRRPLDAEVALRLGDWFRAIRANRAMSQESVAFAAGIDVATYARIERAVFGARYAMPHIQTVLRLLFALGITDAEWEVLRGLLDSLGEMSDDG